MLMDSNPTLIGFQSGRKGFPADSVGFREILQMRTPFSERLTTLRRYLSIAMGDDLSPRSMEGLVSVSNGMWGRYESGETRPRRDVIERLIALANRYGLDWATAGWLDYNEGQGPPPIGKTPAAGAAEPNPDRRNRITVARVPLSGQAYRRARVAHPRIERYDEACPVRILVPRCGESRIVPEVADSVARAASLRECTNGTAPVSGRRIPGATFSDQMEAEGSAVFGCALTDPCSWGMVHRGSPVPRTSDAQGINDPFHVELSRLARTISVSARLERDGTEREGRLVDSPDVLLALLGDGDQET